ncbi:MAG: DNA alkylation repair protein [Lachnospiraceae bacterium]|nr:DNA alkylation repair protein [Lachnospiraceae bacterium]
MIIKEIEDKLHDSQDIKYRDFQSKLIPNVDENYFIGVRTPMLRKFAKEISKREDVQDFLNSKPHKYFDENQLHAFIISDMKDYENCLNELKSFLPYVNNWATCDQMSPKIFKKYKKNLLEEIEVWLNSTETYTVRFAIKMLMEHFLDDDFKEKYLSMVAKVSSDEYYIKMMVAWYFATALAKQYDKAIPYIEQKKLDIWTHNKTIQKSVESYRITKEQKEYLRSLKIKK